MSHVERTQQSWISRLIGSVVGAGIGIVLVLAAFPLLIWNESRAVTRARSLTEGAGAVVSVAADRVDPANEGKLVHVTGTATTEETLSDNLLKVSAPALKLRRVAEMYQWNETSSSQTKEKLGGGTETVTVYEYEQTWSERPIRSSDFKERGHNNPGMAWRSDSWSSSRISLGAFTLSEGQIDKLTDFTPLGLEKGAVELPDDLENATLQDGGIYIGRTAQSASIGDIRIRFEVVKPGAISTIARQMGSSFGAYQASAGSDILLVENGTVPADAMFASAQAENTVVAWLLRAGGFAMMFIGIALAFRPLAILGAVVPFVGRVIGMGTGLVAGVMAFVLSTTTIAVSWIAFRPLIGGTLLVISAMGLFWIVRASRRQPPLTVPPPIPAGS